MFAQFLERVARLNEKFVKETSSRRKGIPFVDVPEKRDFSRERKRILIGIVGELDAFSQEMIFVVEGRRLAERAFFARKKRFEIRRRVFQTAHRTGRHALHTDAHMSGRHASVENGVEAHRRARRSALRRDEDEGAPCVDVAPRLFQRFHDLGVGVRIREIDLGAGLIRAGHEFVDIAWGESTVRHEDRALVAFEDFARDESVFIRDEGNVFPELRFGELHKEESGRLRLHYSAGEKSAQTRGKFFLARDRFRADRRVPFLLTLKSFFIRVRAFSDVGEEFLKAREVVGRVGF